MHRWSIPRGELSRLDCCPSCSSVNISEIDRKSYVNRQAVDKYSLKWVEKNYDFLIDEFPNFSPTFSTGCFDSLGWARTVYYYLELVRRDKNAENVRGLCK